MSPALHAVMAAKAKDAIEAILNELAFMMTT
jgi:hypothetical protein